MNGLLASTLVAAARTRWLPRLTATRVLVAFAMAVPLVRALGGTGAALGIVLAESLLLLLAARACAAAGAPVPLLRPLATAVAATLPMALAVWGVRQQLLLALPIGGLVQAAVTLALAKLALGRQPAGELR